MLWKEEQGIKHRVHWEEMSSKQLPLKNTKRALLLRNLWVFTISLTRWIDSWVDSAGGIERHVVIPLCSSDLTFTVDDFIGVSELVKDILMVIYGMCSFTSWKIQGIIVFIHENCLLLSYVLHGLNSPERIMHRVNYSHDILSGMLPKLANMTEQFLAHIHWLISIFVSCDDIPPVVLEFKIPSLRFFFLLILFQQFLVTMVLLHQLLYLFHLSRGENSLLLVFLRAFLLVVTVLIVNVDILLKDCRVVFNFLLRLWKDKADVIDLSLVLLAFGDVGFFKALGYIVFVLAATILTWVLYVWNTYWFAFLNYDHALTFFLLGCHKMVN